MVSRCYVNDVASVRVKCIGCQPVCIRSNERPKFTIEWDIFSRIYLHRPHAHVFTWSFLANVKRIFNTFETLAIICEKVITILFFYIYFFI